MDTPSSVTAPAWLRAPGWAAGLVLLLVLIGLPAPVRAADPGVATEAVARSGPIRSILVGSLKILKWLVKYVPSLRGLIEAVEELLRIIDDARRASDVQRKFDDVKKRLDEVETRLAKDRSAKAGSARVVVRQLRTEIDRQRRYKPCGIGQHNGPDGTCVDRRLLDRPTAPQ